jgi:hypothetical protein
MCKLINGEIYRLLHKKSMYIYFGSLAVGYFIIAFIRSGGFDENSIVNDAFNFFLFLPPIAGGYLFAAIYTDDLSARNLITLVGFGMGKAKITVAKLIIAALFGTVIFAAAPLVLYAVHAALGWPATAGAMTTIFMVSCKYLLTTLAYCALAGIAVYGLQRATFAMVLYILLSFNVVGGLLTVLFTNMAGQAFAPILTDRLMSGITDRIMAGMMGAIPLTLPVVEYTVYVAIAASLSVIAFRKKEMEF